MSLVIFYHIPKTAGSSFYSVAYENFDRSSLFIVDSSQTGHRASLEKVRSLPVEEKQKLRFILGHGTFGLHAYFQQPCAYITFLRDPIARMCSDFYHLTRTDAEIPERVAFKTSTPELDDCLKEGELHYGRNPYVKMLLGIKDRRYEATLEDLEKADHTLLEQFALVCPTDRFDEGLVLLNEKMGWKIKGYDRSNVADNYDRSAVNIDDLRDRYLSLYALDEELCQRWSRRFENELSKVNDLERKLNILRLGVRQRTGTFHVKRPLWRRMGARIRRILLPDV